MKSQPSELTTPHGPAERVRAGIALYQQSSTPIRSRSHAEFAAFFTGLDVVGPGIVSAAQWQPQAGRDSGVNLNSARQVYLAACARLP